MKHKTLPVFVPHRGCPRACVFCDQKSITEARFDPLSVKRMLEEAFSDPALQNAQIAFFGGSFTAIDRELMLFLLDTAEEFVKRGQASSLRFSTRPDAMGEEVIRLLRRYSVKDVELGIQSLSDRVLAACNRGHSAEDSRRAAERILRESWTLTGQMMLGLPASSPEEEEQSARGICAMGAASARVYPTVVFSSTPLGQMTEEGTYLPLGPEEAVERGARVCRIFLKEGVKLLRVGLCDNATLHSHLVLGGGNLPSYGERVYSRIWQKALLDTLLPLKEEITGRALELYCHPRALSRLSGYEKENKRLLMQVLRPSRLGIFPRQDGAQNTFYYEIGEQACRKKGFSDVLKDT